MSCATLCAASHLPFASCQSASSVGGIPVGGAGDAIVSLNSASVFGMRDIIPADSMLSPAFDVGQALDEGRWTAYQKTLVALAALTILFDGIDNQLLGVTIPSLMREWGLARAAFAPVASLSLFGMMVGGAIAGIAGDRFGRRRALFVSMSVFGVCTLGVAAVHSI